MKKSLLTLAIFLGMTLCASAQGGMFGYGHMPEDGSFSRGRSGSGMIGLPAEHELEGDTPAPLGSGALLLIGFGAAYALKKANKK